METRTLPLASERAVYQAMFEYLDGAVKPRDVGELTLDTATGTLRFIDSVCFAAPEADLVGAELAGWLVESARASAVVTRWRRGARAVLVKAPASVLLSGSTNRMSVDGADARDGHVTHEGPLVVVHGSNRPASRAEVTSEPPEAQPFADAARQPSDSEPEVVLEDPADARGELAPSPPPLRSEVQALLTDDAADLAPWSQPPPLSSYTAPSAMAADFELPALDPPPSFLMAGEALADLAGDDELDEMETRPRGERSEPQLPRRAGGQ